MFDTTDYYIASEIAYRRERIASDWEAANWRHARSGRARRGSSRLRRNGSRLQRPTRRAAAA